MKTVVRSHGFTLIELLVVISIISLLMGILLPALSKARLTARNIIGASNMRQVAIALNTYAVDNNGYMPTDKAVMGISLFGYNAAAGKSLNHEELVGGELAELGGGGYIWNSEEDYDDPQDQRGTPSMPYLGLGKLIENSYIDLDSFFHPVMQDASATSGFARVGWWYRTNIGDLAHTQAVGNGTPASAPTPTRPPGAATSFSNYSGGVASTLIYRGADRSFYEGDQAADDPQLKLAHAQVDHPRTAGKAVIMDTAFDNQGNRMGGVLGFSRVDGSTSFHSHPNFFGTASANSFSQAGIVATTGPVVSWPGIDSVWTTTYWPAIHGGPAAGAWFHWVDRWDLGEE